MSANWSRSRLSHRRALEPRAAWLAVALALATSPAAFAGPAASLAPVPTPADTTTRAGRWQGDLQFLVAQLRWIHPKPFQSVSESEFMAATADLERRLPSLGDASTAFEMQSLVARLRDGHTSFAMAPPWPGIDRLLPLRVYPFQDGLYVTVAAREYATLVGGRVTRIGALDADAAFERVRVLASGDNEFTTLDRAPSLLMNPVLLATLGIAPSEDSCSFEVEGRDGKHHQATVKAVALAAFDMHRMLRGDELPVADGVRALDGAGGPAPLYLRARDKNYWFEYVPESKLLYFQFNSVQNDPDESFADFCRRMFDFVDQHDIDRMVIDVRFNHGGNNQLVKPLIRGLIKRDETVNRRGHLFTITGRGTFSAAMNTTAWLEQNTNTLFVGEPTGAMPNHFGDATLVTLPYSHLQVWISHWAWQNTLPWDARPYIAPHLPAPLSFADYATNRDPALDAVLHYGEEPSLTDRVRPLLEIGNREGARAAYAEYRKRHPDLWGRTTETEINALGYALLGDGKTDLAIEVLHWNVASYPKSPNAYDSVAEAYLKQGDMPQATAWYRKTLEVDPQFANATQMLQRLAAHGGTPPAGH